MSTLQLPQLYAQIIEATERGKAEFFYDAARDKKCCAIGEAVLLLEELEHGAFYLRYHTFNLLWFDGLDGWELISRAFAQVSKEDEDPRAVKVRRMSHEVLCRQIATALSQ